MESKVNIVPEHISRMISERDYIAAKLIGAGNFLKKESEAKKEDQKLDDTQYQYLMSQVQSMQMYLSTLHSRIKYDLNKACMGYSPTPLLQVNTVSAMQFVSGDVTHYAQSQFVSDKHKHGYSEVRRNADGATVVCICGDGEDLRELSLSDGTTFLKEAASFDVMWTLY